MKTDYLEAMCKKPHFGIIKKKYFLLTNIPIFYGIYLLAIISILFFLLIIKNINNLEIKHKIVRKFFIVFLPFIVSVINFKYILFFLMFFNPYSSIFDSSILILIHSVTIIIIFSLIIVCNYKYYKNLNNS